MEPTNAEKLAAGLPEWLPRGPETDNAKLLESVGDALDRIESDYREVGNAIHPQTAGTIEQLEKIAARMGVEHRPNEAKETYRIRTIAAHQLLTTGGTLDDTIGNLATILDIDPAAIVLEEMIEPGTIPIQIPNEALSNVGLLPETLNSIIKDQSAAGYRPLITTSGTLEYISAAEYDAGTYDSSAGYDGLDVGGTPTGEGGTYGDLLE